MPQVVPGLSTILFFFLFHEFLLENILKLKKIKVKGTNIL
jgi:hypothetical protein